MKQIKLSSVTHDILKSANIGLWAVEAEEGKHYRMYADEKMLQLIGIEGTFTPEELYDFWFEKIDHNYYDEVGTFIEKMAGGVHSEVQYPYHHPTLGTIYVRCGGTRNFSVTDMMRFEGCHQDISELIQVKKEVENYIPTRAFTDYLMKSFTYAYYVNLTDMSFVALNVLDIDETVAKTNYYESAKNYAKNKVHSEDQKAFLENLKCNTIRKRLEKDNSYSIVFRENSEIGERNFKLEIIRGADFDHAAIGFIDVTNEIANERKNNEIIEALASEYTSVFYVNLETEEIKTYAMNEDTENAFGETFRSGIKYSDAYSMYVDKFVLETEKINMLLAGSVPNIKKQLEGRKSFDTVYVNFRNHFCKVKFVKVGDDAEPLYVALGFADKDEEIRKHQEHQDIIRGLSEEYEMVCYVNSETKEEVIYRFDDKYKDVFPRWNEINDFTERLDYIASMIQSREERKKFIDATRMRKIMSELKRDSAYFVNFTNGDSENNLEYWQVKFVLAAGDRKRIIAGFCNVDEETHRRVKEKEKTERNYELIRILASEYSSVYYVNLATGEVVPYTMNEYTQSAIREIITDGTGYTEAYRKYVGALVHPEDKEKMLKAGSVGNIMKELRKKKTFVTEYRSNDDHYCEMKFVKVGREEDEPLAIALGFADKNSELRAKEEEEKVLKRNIDIIEILASEYSSVYYLDLMTEEVEPYGKNDGNQSDDDEFFYKGCHFSKALASYIENKVYEEDRKKLAKAGSLYNILSELSNKKSFSTIYRIGDKVNQKYCEMKVIKVGDDENPSAVAIGFADKDTEIREENKNRESRERDTAVISALADDFGCIIYVDLAEHKETIYRTDSVFERTVPDWYNIENFAVRIQMIGKYIVHPEDKETFLKAASKEGVMENLRLDGIYYVNFRTLIAGEVTYYQAKFVSDENSDHHLIAGFRSVDAETKREMETLERAEAANKAKTLFLNNMSHDIRTPMNAIMGFTDIAIKNIDNKQKAIECLTKAKTSSEYLLSLINDILDMSRIESGKVELEEKPADILECGKQIKPMLVDLAQRKDITIDFTVNDIRDRYVYLDYLRMNQVIINIVSNSVKYTDNGGTIKVVVSQIGKCKDGKAEYEFIVSDNGIGMSKDFVKIAFDTFSREKTSTVSKKQGTGLGLAITKNIVDMMKGTIKVDSELGVGSTFTIRVPFRVQENPEDNIQMSLLENEPEIVLEGKRILMVEDNELNREISMEVLSEAGIIVDEAEDGAKAVERVKEVGIDYYDCILMDIQMPVMNGYEATKAIRRMKNGRKVPIIALSANAFEDDKAKSLEAGMDDHQSKPIIIPKLLESMRKVMTDKNS